MSLAPPYTVPTRSRAVSAGEVFRVGDIKWHTSETPPSANWLIAQGQAISRTTYAAAYAILGTAYGAGDGSTTFNLPDLVGAVTEGVASDASRAQKATQATHGHTKSGSVASANAAHSHGGAATSASPANHDHNTFDGATPSTTGGTNQDMSHTHPISSDNAAHSHTDSLAFADASAGLSTTKLVPFIKVI